MNLRYVMLGLGAAVAVGIATVAALVLGGSDPAGARGGDKRMVKPTIPVTPSVQTLSGEMAGGGTRTFKLTASEFEQKLANFPLEKARVWGYNKSTPGPTLIAYEGERLRVELDNQLPEPTTIHFHGAGAPNKFDGVAGISQPEPIGVGKRFAYEFRLRRAGTFAYHSHTRSAVQELRGLDGFLLVLPRREPASQRVDKDFAMTLQQFAPPKEGGLVDPFPPGTGDFPISTINGKTGEASGGALTIRRGDRVRIRLYNASNLSHSMHLHGMAFEETAKNGYAIPRSARSKETTVNVAPGEFVDIEFLASNPGNWIFHCHVPHHTSNKMMDGFKGAPVGMTRVFHYEGFRPVPKGYFDFAG